MEVIEGDIIVMGSDGLFDNVFDNEIVSAIARSNDTSEAGMSPSSIDSFENSFTWMQSFIVPLC